MKVGWATCLIWIFSCACLWLAGHFSFIVHAWKFSPADSGMPWPAGVPDTSKYQYKVESQFLVESDWHRIDDTDDPRPEAVLIWLANNEVYLCGRKDILYGDSDIYYVKKHSIYNMADGHWAACIEAYGVWECEDVVIHFQLVYDGQAQ